MRPRKGVCGGGTTPENPNSQLSSLHMGMPGCTCVNSAKLRGPSSHCSTEDGTARRPQHKNSCISMCHVQTANPLIRNDFNAQSYLVGNTDVLDLSVNVLEPSHSTPASPTEKERLATHKASDGTKDKGWCVKENRQPLNLFGGERNEFTVTTFINLNIEQLHVIFCFNTEYLKVTELSVKLSFNA